MLMLHKGGHAATLQDLRDVPLPKATHSHQPVPHDLFVDMVVESVERSGMVVRSMNFGLNRSGAQMFGVIKCDAIDDETGIVFGLRGSHDKSMSKGLCGGRTVFVCDNMVFSGESFVVMRRHTRNILSDLADLIGGAVAETEAAQAALGNQIDTMRQIDIDTDAGYEILGRAYGSKLLTSTQATRAFSEWRKPTHEQFSPRNLWSLHNAGTESLKLGGVRGAISRHTRWHDHIVNELP